MIPEFAIMGHPNEGKSSVLSTLAEDDSVRISDTPGETRECRTFPVVIDGREVLRFTDTPGFQNPGRVLAELRRMVETESDPLAAFRAFAQDIPELHDDRELLAPVTAGAGIIYVVDGSRPVRRVDRTEMEILRLTGRPRMAIINCKDGITEYLEAWKLEFRKNFNSSRIFNAHRASWAERISLLEALKSIDQDWQSALGEVVEAFRRNWAERNEQSAAIIVKMLSACLRLKVNGELEEESRLEEIREKLLKKYGEKLTAEEHLGQSRLRALYKHNIFNYQLPPHSLLHSDILDERNWELLGLSKSQLLLTGALGGAAAGLGLDAMTLGSSFGIFATVGGVLGGIGAMWGGENLAGQKKILGIPLPSLGGEQLQIGPAKEINLLFILLNRALLYYRHIINWAHGRRDYEKMQKDNTDENFTREWGKERMSICRDYFAALGGAEQELKNAEEKLRRLLVKVLTEIGDQ
jgi:hypothetical protein